MQPQQAHPLPQEFELPLLAQTVVHLEHRLLFVQHRRRIERVLLTEELVEEVHRQRATEARAAHSRAMELTKQVEVGRFFAGFELESHGASVEILLDAAGEEADFALNVGRGVEG